MITYHINLPCNIFFTVAVGVEEEVVEVAVVEVAVVVVVVVVVDVEEVEADVKESKLII